MFSLLCICMYVNIYIFILYLHMPHSINAKEGMRSVGGGKYDTFPPDVPSVLTTNNVVSTLTSSAWKGGYLAWERKRFDGYMHKTSGFACYLKAVLFICEENCNHEFSGKGWICKVLSRPKLKKKNHHHRQPVCAPCARILAHEVFV